MRAGVVVFPGSNCDRDLAVGFESIGAQVSMVWHKDTALPEGLDIIGIPGGFSFGDYLRCGAIAAQSPICRAVADFAGRGGYVMGICNGFQILTETRLLPGSLMRNAGLTYICKNVDLVTQTTDSPYTNALKPGETLSIPIAHHDGNYVADDALLARLKGEDRIAFTYDENPNGSAGNIAGVFSENRRVLGMMPHPERAIDPAHGGSGGAGIFASLVGAFAAA